MKWIADKEGEDFVNENAWDVMIPVSYTKIDGALTVEYYPEVREEIQCFFREHEDDPFSDGALSRLFSLLGEYFERKGYEDDRFRDRWGYVYRGVATASATGAEPLLSADEEDNNTTYDIEASLDDGRLVYGVKADGRVVSVAVTHTAPDEAAGDTVEVGVETAPGFRGRGYATLALSALSQELFRRGFLTEYRCQRYNGASRKVAERAGLSEVGKYYYYVGRRKHGV